MTRRHYFLVLVCICAFQFKLSADPGDTTIVQTFTFEAQNNTNTSYDSPGRRWFDFPAADNGTEYQKILMYHTLKCFEGGGAGGLAYPCGEWDYLTYNYLFQHTGQLDSTHTWTWHYLLDNQSFANANLSSTPNQDIQQFDFDFFVVDEIVSEVQAITGASDNEQYSPFSEDPRRRVQYLVTADELIGAGLQSGVISQLSFATFSESDFHHLFSLRLKQTSANELFTFENGGFQLVYQQDVFLPTIGENEFFFDSPFSWDGISNLILECTYDNYSGGPTAEVYGSESTFSSTVVSSGNDKYIHFDGNDFVYVPSSAFENVSNEITIAFWQFGTPEFQPMDGTCFEAANSQNQRVLNAHLPWSNGRVYWDAGWNNGYDRIDKLATTSNYEGQWNYWAFTKNSVSGEMKIYLNGVLWHSGVDKYNLMLDIQKFYIGGASTWSNFYKGDIDEFSIWNIALDATTIQDWMMKDIDDSHPYYNRLQAYYQFNENNNEQVLDHSGNGNNAWVIGSAQRELYQSSDLFRNGTAEMWRPQISFYQGEYLTHMESYTSEWTLPSSPVSLAEYAINGNSVSLDNVQYFYYPGWNYVYNAQGVIIDSIPHVVDTTIENDTLWYYQSPFEVINRFELGRYITPYGIGLDLQDGWTWIYDVTDFAPLLRDSAELEAGNWQELLDLKFLFIEGTPARPVNRIENVWNGNYGLSTFDQNVTAKSLNLQPGDETVKLRTTVTGHGFGNDNNNCGEFCYNSHRLNVNGTPQWSWEIVQECDQNPLYPQGGTWIYARAGWCPGMEGKTNEFELKPYILNNTVSVDYDIEMDPYGNYVTESQAVFYGANSYAVDPEIEMILAPSNFKLNSRWNPMCDNPKFVLRNMGTNPLTQINVNFGVVGGTEQTFVWTGNLEFGESEAVELSYSDNALWQGSPNEILRFYVDLVNSSNGVDENPSNNHAESTFIQPVLYSYMPDDPDDNRMIIIFKTNLQYLETSYSLTDINGNVVFARNDFDQPNQIYRDTIQLNQGCYRFHLEDTDGDGLNFFANSDGNGYCKLDRVAGAYFIELERNFGQDLDHYFYFETNLVSVENVDPRNEIISCSPNPASESVRIAMSGMNQNVNIRILDMNGRLVLSKSLQRKSSIEAVDLDISSIAPGLYVIQVFDDVRTGSLRLIKQ